MLERLCDLRHVKTSVEMGSELVSALIVAFNAGEIRPTGNVPVICATVNV